MLATFNYATLQATCKPGSSPNQPEACHHQASVLVFWFVYWTNHPWGGLQKNENFP